MAYGIDEYGTSYYGGTPVIEPIIIRDLVDADIEINDGIYRVEVEENYNVTIG